MKMISKCHYCQSDQVIQLAAFHLGKKIEVNVKCQQCAKFWTELWTLTKIDKYIPADLAKTQAQSSAGT